MHQIQASTKTLIVLSIGVFVFAFTSYAYAAGNQTISISPTSGTWASSTATFSHDTLLGTLNRNMMVVYNASGTIRYFIASSTNPQGGDTSKYFIVDTDSPHTLASWTTSSLAAGDYLIANASLGSTCCTNAQNESNSQTLSDLQAYTSGYVSTATFTIVAPSTSTTSSVQWVGAQAMSITLDNTLVALVHLIVFIGGAWFMYKVMT